MARKPTKRERREAARLAAQRRQRLRWTGLALVAVLGVGSFVIFGTGSQDQAAAMAPDFQLESSNGEQVRLSDYLGRPVALTFMHTY